MIADGWTITHDPLTVAYGDRDLFVDLGAERAAMAAEKEGVRIAVEVHSFVELSPVKDLQSAVGQYEVYRTVLGETHPGRILYLAVPFGVFDTFLTERFELILDRLKVRLIVFEESTERIVQWIG